MVRKSTFEKFHKTKTKFLFRTFYICKEICKMYTLQIFNEIIDNQDLYRNKDDF